MHYDALTSPLGRLSRRGRPATFATNRPDRCETEANSAVMEVNQSYPRRCVPWTSAVSRACDGRARRCRSHREWGRPQLMEIRGGLIYTRRRSPGSRFCGNCPCHLTGSGYIFSPGRELRGKWIGRERRHLPIRRSRPAAFPWWGKAPGVAPGQRLDRHLLPCPAYVPSAPPRCGAGTLVAPCPSGPAARAAAPAALRRAPAARTPPPAPAPRAGTPSGSG